MTKTPFTPNKFEMGDLVWFRWDKKSLKGFVIGVLKNDYLIATRSRSYVVFQRDITCKTNSRYSLELHLVRRDNLIPNGAFIGPLTERRTT